MLGKVFLLACFCLVHHAFSQQLAPGQLKQKVDEIAKAYAEGYKAAITALKARSMIPKKQFYPDNKPQVNQRSFIPKPLGTQVVQNVPMAPGNGFPFPARQVTVNGVEKSGIPRPQFQSQLIRPMTQRNALKPAGHTVVERSAAPPPLLGKFMDQQMGKKAGRQLEKKSNVLQMTGGSPRTPDEGKAAQMAKMNAAARHRNVYFDAMGGDPYGGASAVLSHQHVELHRSRRSAARNSLRKHFRRHQRSRMPYLGQDLDKLGIVRAVPVFNSPEKQQDNGLPSFMKVHAAEFGSFKKQNGNAFAAARKSGVSQPMFYQQADQYPNSIVKVLRR